MLQQYLPFTVLKQIKQEQLSKTIILSLQQYLPFTVLKLGIHPPTISVEYTTSLQQYLPFTVLKRTGNRRVYRNL